MNPDVVRYGPEPDQFAQLWRPADERRLAGPTQVPAHDDAGPAPVVVLVHGGFWRHRYRLDLMEPLAADLCARGYAVWNLEYRRTGGPGGGWPGTFEDIATGVDALASVTGVEPARTAIVGHSAGGHLALWACARPFGPRRVVPGFAVSLAGVCDLTEAARQRLSNDAVVELLGGTPQQQPDRYRAACPTLLLPLRVPQLVVHGTDDANVPFTFGPRYAAAASAAGDPCELMVLPGVDHFAVIDPTGAPWTGVAERLDRWRAAR